jgi:TonB family protein
MNPTDNKKQLFRDMQEHPDNYSDEQIEAMMDDLDQIPDVETEWKKFEEVHLKKQNHKSLSSSILMAAAVFIGLLVCVLLVNSGKVPNPFAPTDNLISKADVKGKNEIVSQNPPQKNEEEECGPQPGVNQQTDIPSPSVDTKKDILIPQSNEADPKTADATKEEPVTSVKCEECEERVFSVIEQQPSFPGGQKALIEFFNTNIKYPEEVTQDGIHGRVIISFVINEDGTADDFKVVKNTLRNSEDNVCTDSTIIRLFEEEALRVCKLMPRWAPGKQNGQAVKVRYNYPISFRK